MTNTGLPHYLRTILHYRRNHREQQGGDIRATATVNRPLTDTVTRLLLAGSLLLVASLLMAIIYLLR